MQDTEIKLTQFSKGAGCGCKIAPSVLEEIIKTESRTLFTQLLVGNETKDDAAVYDTGNGDCIISTTDFFMPIVNDAFDFGRIASANAISDVYAMGGKPVMAIAILGWPIEKLPVELAKNVIDGARVICEEAGIPLAGGHSVDSQEPIFGLSVTGTLKKEHLKRNNTVKNGDSLYLTKPLGVGVMATALKRGLLEQEDYQVLTATMTTLNKIGEQLGKQSYVHALTDVTGFGLIGHLTEMMGDSGLTAKINYKLIPHLKEVEKYTSKFIYPDSTTRNYNTYKEKVKGLDGLEFITLCDPQTSGGLLVAIDPIFEKEAEKLFAANNVKATKIGNIEYLNEPYLIDLVR